MLSVKRSTSKETFKLLVSALHCVAPLFPPHGFLSVPTLRLLLNFWSPPKSFNTKKELRQRFALSKRLRKSNLKICKWQTYEHNFPDIEVQRIYKVYILCIIIGKSPKRLQKMPLFCFFDWTFISVFKSLCHIPVPVNVIGNFSIAISEHG